ncbi:hypothetical protein KR026_007807 [Drosophila bipectinata]|nr:hypothetical protein KR026_007807 [Drosophila bipectinata]
MLSLTAILSLGQAVDLPQTTDTTATTTTGKPQTSELPQHIKDLITSHINHVLQHIKNNPSPTTLTGSIDGSSGSNGNKGITNGTPVVVPYPDLLPPLAHSGDVHAPAPVDQPAAAPALQPGLQSVQAGNPSIKVTDHKATGILLHQGRPVIHNKVQHLGDSSPVIDVSEKLHSLQHHVNKVMQQAEQHIPLAVQQAIRKRKEQQEQREKQEQLQKDKEQKEKDQKDKEPEVEKPAKEDPSPNKTPRALVIPPHVSNIVNQVHAHIPQLIAQHKEEIKLGKCSFQCPREALNICASNGKCVVNFPGQCELSQWNCFNTKNVFHQVHDSECQNTIKCYQRDMM